MGKGSRSREQRLAVEAIAPKAKKTHGKLVRNIVLSVAGALVAVALVFGVLYGNGVLQRSLTAMRVGDQKISTMEYSYYYSQIRNNFVNNYGASLEQSGIAINALDSQMYSEDMTFGEFFKQQTATQLTNIYSIYGEAKAANYEMSEEGNKTLQAALDSLTTAATEQKSTPEKLLQATVSAPISMNDYTQILTRSVYANTYYDEMVQTDEFSAADIDNYYSENSAEFDKVDYRVMMFPFVAGADEAETTKNKADAKAQADAMLAEVSSEASFIELSRKYAPAAEAEEYADDAKTLTEGYSLAGQAGIVADWVKDDARKAGDKEVLSIDTNYSVVYFINRYRDENPTINVRHILFESDETNDAEKKALAESVLAEFNAGDKTEDSFAALATANTEDPGSSSTGGLYEGVTKGYMVAEFDTWIFDSARKPGNTGIVKTDYGYHVMYFVSQGEQAWKLAAQTALQDAEYTQFIEAATSKYEITSSNFAIKFAM